MDFNDILMQLQQIDYTAIMAVIGSVFIFHKTDRVIKGYNLRKDLKPKNVSKVILPPELIQEYDDIDINKLASQRFEEIVVKFAECILNNFSKEDLTNFYNNLNEVEINMEKFGKKANMVANYNVLKNKIKVDGEEGITSLYHELFHMASSTYKDGIFYSGFYQGTLEPLFSLGKGINEGYTQFLTERYFSNDADVVGTYIFEVMMADKLEQIVGKEKMESYYLNANLYGLINELKQYISEEEIMKFINDIDFIAKHLEDKKLLPFEKKMIKDTLKDVFKFLLKSFIIKGKKQYDAGILDKEELRGKLATYITSFPNSIETKWHSFDFVTADILEESMNSIVSDIKITISINNNEENKKKSRRR